MDEPPRPSTNPAAMDRIIVRSPWRKRLPFIAAGIALALTAAAAFTFMPGADSLVVERDDVEITPARQAAFKDYLPVRAEIAPRETVFIDAVEGGRVERRLVEDGALVGAGTLLAVLSNPQLELEVTSREAQIAGGLSDVSGQRLALERTRLEREREISQANFELLKANRELQVHRSLHSKGFQSDARLEIATTEANYHRQRVAALQQGARQEAGLTAGQRAEIGRTADRLHGNLREVREGLRALEIRAPVAGRLTAFELQPGQAVQPRQRVGQVDSEGAYKLTAQIDEFYLGRVSVGQSATAEHEGRTYRLRVSRIVPQVQEGRFQTELEFVRETPPSLRRGQTLDLEVTLGDTRPALILPNGPFVETTGGTWVFVLEPGGRRAERRTIRTGRRNPLEIEVLSGLKAGEQVVTSSYEGFARQSRLILR